MSKDLSYTNDEITVVWNQLSACIPQYGKDYEVFNPAAG
jgi:hypothetical protein